MQQMGGMMEYIVDGSGWFPDPEQTKQMGEMMGHIAEMTNHLASMMSGAVGGGDAATDGDSCWHEYRDAKRMISLMAELIHHQPPHRTRNRGASDANHIIKGTTMQVRQIVLSAVLVVLVRTPGFALAQGATGHWLLHDSRGGPADRADRGSTMQMQGLMQQMGDDGAHGGARPGWSLTLRVKQMAELMRITDMTTHLAWMMGVAHRLWTCRNKWPPDGTAHRGP